MNKLLCRIFGHKDETVHQLSIHTCRVQCRRCGGDWGIISTPGGSCRVPWSPKLDELTDRKGFMEKLVKEMFDE